jgi:hypothetical protein
MISPFCLMYNENRAWATLVSCSSSWYLSLVAPNTGESLGDKRTFHHRNPVPSVATVPTVSPHPACCIKAPVSSVATVPNILPHSVFRKRHSTPNYLMIRAEVNVQGDEKRGALTLTKESCSMVLYSGKDLSLLHNSKK